MQGIGREDEKRKDRASWQPCVYCLLLKEPMPGLKHQPQPQPARIDPDCAFKGLLPPLPVQQRS